MERKTILYLILGISIVLIIFAISWCWIDSSVNSIEQRGQFGDKFGAINALFSSLAFSVITIALILQSQELKASLDEMKENKGVSIYQAEIQKLSTRISGLNSILETQKYYMNIAVESLSKSSKKEDTKFIIKQMDKTNKKIEDVHKEITNAIEELNCLNSENFIN